MEHLPQKWVAGKDMAHIETIKNGFIEITNGLISDFEAWKIERHRGLEHHEIIDADGGMVFPCYCDSHTHIVFIAIEKTSGSTNGCSYAEIAQNGGGIPTLKKITKRQPKRVNRKYLNRINDVMKMVLAPQKLRVAMV